MVALAIPLNAVLALIAALLWGGGDFTGGMGVKGAGGSLSAALRVVLMSHGASLVALYTAGFLLHDAPFPHGAPLAWAIAAGLMGGSSVCAFYIALSRGAMGASAAVSGLLAAAIPALVSIATEGAPASRHLAGFAIAGASIWLIAAAPGERSNRVTMTLATLSGAGFGLYFVALKFAGKAGIVWPMAAARTTSVLLCSTALLVLLAQERRTNTRTPVTINRSTLLWALGTAIMDTSGNMFFVGATRAGRLDVASVLASLYPATTILLAAWTLHEKPTRRQALGMALAAAAVVLITL